MTNQQKRPNRTVQTGAIVALALGMSLHVPTFAAEGETEPAAKTSTNTPEKPTARTNKSNSETEGSTNKKAKRGKDGEIFRPSEEISEDFAVSFPVDI